MVLEEERGGEEAQWIGIGIGVCSWMGCTTGNIEIRDCSLASAHLIRSSDGS